jgi:hypothetical protein
MSYKKNELIESLLQFKQENGRFPSRQDFQMGRVGPGKSTFYRAFGSIENAIGRAIACEKGEIVIEDKNSTTRSRSRSVPGGMQCPFCGGLVDRISEFYSSLVVVLSSRFIGLLKSRNGQTYADGVLDCISAVFGPTNPVIKNALLKAGFISLFENRHKTAEIQSEKPE